MKILIADDKEEGRYLLETLLKANGHKVISVANGVEALDKLKSAKFDLIISDILMPVMDGFELCRKIKADKTLQQIPFIFYTATYTDQQDEAFALKIGADRFIVKPSEPETLMKIVNETMAATGRRGTDSVPAQDTEEEILKLYNERLVKKLEDKMIELELEVRIRQEAEENAKTALESWQTTFDAMLDPVTLLDTDGTVKQCNRAFANFLGQDAEALVGQKCHQLVHHSGSHIPECPLVNALQSVARKTKEMQIGENTFHVVVDPIIAADGQVKGFVHIMRDITEQKMAAQEMTLLQEQFRQSQKMEAIGRLAGGIAHDFNNLLTIIEGNAQLSLLALQKDDPLMENIEEINTASNKASDLTRQLLAFSRKQIMQMQALDLNHIIEGLNKMLHRILGEDIEMVALLNEGIGIIKADPGQIEQVIVNLAVNSKDAMPDGGKLMIETADVTLDEEYSSKHIGANPGQYVMLSVSDTGAGMAAEVKERLFEPFFTTKETGKGTGLGLSTVYGIVKQSGGTIWVYSELGQGTTFKIYLPKVDERLTEMKKEIFKEIPRGNETILIVEDDESVRKLSVRMLKSLGYRILEASDGGNALLLCEEFKEPIHLILTDMVMPGMSGDKLVDRLKTIHPEMKCIFMSGYTDNAILYHGILEGKVNFIQKPFAMDRLARKVREVLNQP